MHKAFKQLLPSVPNSLNTAQPRDWMGGSTGRAVHGVGMHCFFEISFLGSVDGTQWWHQATWEGYSAAHKL